MVKRNLMTSLFALGVAFALAGCGGITTGLSNASNADFRSATLASFKGSTAGIKYAYFAMKMAAPSTSTFAVKRPGVGTRVTGTYDSTLNLYYTLSQAGNVVSVNYFTDSALTTSAGTMTITLPIANTVYSVYPANVAVHVAVTGGNLPTTGDINLSFTDGTGANTLTGTLTTTADSVTTSFNLTLDDANNVGGTASVTEGADTINLTNLTGNINSALSGNVAIQPVNISGTAQINLVTGAVSISVNVSGGTATAATNSAGAFNVTYSDGTKTSIPSPLTASVAG